MGRGNSSLSKVKQRLVQESSRARPPLGITGSVMCAALLFIAAFSWYIKHNDDGGGARGVALCPNFLHLGKPLFGHHAGLHTARR